MCNDTKERQSQA
ncbi:MAG: hypothetical protein D3925_06420 [Candidatus Electrothrix sp. AR5]|nr:hypothetical protein [Candidatus Electrothrix sp. AR5]